MLRERTAAARGSVTLGGRYSAAGLCLLAGLLAGLGEGAAQEPSNQPPAAERAIERAVTFLAREVPAWRRENSCYSCHNNGDGVRALYAARRHGLEIPETSLTETARWLLRPAEWKNNGGEQDYDDPQLFALQFGGALLAAQRAEAVEAREPLRLAARQLAAFQREEGDWRTVQPGMVGSPINYGGPLATVRGMELLRGADAETHAARLERAGRYLREYKAQNVMDAAAVLLGLAGETDQAAAARRKQCRELLLPSQRSDGGWGPYRQSAAEPFDTALALLALAGEPIDDDLLLVIRRGRRYLARTQIRDGSWPGTTRPAGVESYGHRVSTTAWALLALLETAPADLK